MGDNGADRTPAGGFIWPIRVYYEDTDAGGVVFYANYLKYLERARTEWLRSLGFEQDLLRERERVLFAVTRVELDYRQPARFNEQLLVTTRLVERRRVGLTFAQEVRRHDDPAILCAGRVTLVCLDADRFRPRPLPERLKTEIEHGL